MTRRESRECKSAERGIFLESGLQEYFAVKATPNPFLIDILKEYGCGCDCSSYTELMLSEALDITGEDIMFSSNDTPAEDFILADRVGAIINLDDITHIDFWRKRSDIFRRRSAAVSILAVCSRSAMTSWIIRAMPNTV